MKILNISPIFFALMLALEFEFTPVFAASTRDETSISNLNQLEEAATEFSAEKMEDSIEMADTRIIGGSDAILGQFPWQVSLQLVKKPGEPSSHRCGGTLISPTRVISAAHCLQGLPIQKLSIVAGALNISNRFESTRQTVALESFVLHENYSGLDNDIAVLKLATRINFTDYIRPLRLSPVEPVSPGKSCVNSGWGVTYQNPNGSYLLPETLQQVNLTIWTQSDCEKAYDEFIFGNYSVTLGMVCAGHGDEFERKGACFGDSGGPLVCFDQQGPYLAGIDSWTNTAPCGQSAYPTVFCRVSYYLEWIRAHLN